MIFGGIFGDFGANLMDFNVKVLLSFSAGHLPEGWHVAQRVEAPTAQQSAAQESGKLSNTFCLALWHGKDGMTWGFQFFLFFLLNGDISWWPPLTSWSFSKLGALRWG